MYIHGKKDVNLSLGVLNINFGGEGVTFQCFYCPVSSAEQNLVIKHVMNKHPGKELKLKRIPKSLQPTVGSNNTKDVSLRDDEKLAVVLSL